MEQMLFEASAVRPSVTGTTPFLAYRSMERRLDDCLSGMRTISKAASLDAGNPLIVSGPDGFCVFPHLSYLTTHPDSPLHGVHVADVWDEDGRLFVAEAGKGEQVAVEVLQLSDAGVERLREAVGHRPVGDQAGLRRGVAGTAGRAPRDLG